MADTGNNRIQFFTAKGEHLQQFWGYDQDKHAFQFQRPIGVVSDFQSNLFVVDSMSSKINHFKREGNVIKYIGSFGSKGNGPGQLGLPWGIGLLSDGRIVVSEYGNNRLSVFSPWGGPNGNYTFLNFIGLYTLDRPFHLCVDRKDNIIVADSRNDQITIFQSNGNLLAEIENPILFDTPNGVTLDGNGRIVVSQPNYPCIMVL